MVNLKQQRKNSKSSCYITYFKKTEQKYCKQIFFKKNQFKIRLIIILIFLRLVNFKTFKQSLLKHSQFFLVFNNQNETFFAVDVLQFQIRRKTTRLISRH